MKIEQLKKLIDKHAEGSQARFALMLGKSPSQVNQWLAAKRPIGAKIERDIAIRFGPMRPESGNVSSAGAAPTVSGALDVIETACEKLGHEQRKEAASLLSIFVVGLRQTTKQDILEVLGSAGNTPAHPATETAAFAGKPPTGKVDQSTPTF